MRVQAEDDCYMLILVLAERRFSRIFLDWLTET